MKPRFHVQQSGQTWIVLDRLKVKLHNDVVMVLPTRKAARDAAREMNAQERPSTVEEVQHGRQAS